MQLTIGARVLSGDGRHAGSVGRFIVTRGTVRLEGIVVQEGGPDRNPRVITCDLIERVDGEQTVHLKLPYESVRDLPFYTTDRLTSLSQAPLFASDRAFVSTLEESLARSRDVFVLDEETDVIDSLKRRIGHVAAVVCDTRRHLTSIIVDVGFIAPGGVVVPASAISRADEGWIALEAPLGSLVHA